MILLSGQAVFAEPDGTEGPVTVPVGEAWNDTDFRNAVGEKAKGILFVEGHLSLKDALKDQPFFQSASTIHVRKGGTLKIHEENSLQSANNFTGKIILYPEGELRFQKFNASTIKIWFGKKGSNFSTDARAVLSKGTITLSNWNKMSKGEFLIELSNDAELEIIDGSIIGAGTTNPNAGAEKSDFSAIFYAPTGSQIVVKNNGRLILPNNSRNFLTAHTKFQPTLNFDGKLTVESGGKLLAFENSVINANGMIEIEDRGKLAANGNSVFNASGDVVLKQGATVELRDNSLLQIASGGDFLVGNGGQMTIEPNVSVSGNIQVDGEVIIKANSLDKLQVAKFILQENGKIFSLHNLEMNLTNAELQTEKEKINEVDYFCWVYKKESSNGGGTGDNNNTGNQGSTGQDNSGTDQNNSSGQNTGEQNGTSGSNNNSNESGTNNNGSNNDSANSGGNQSGTGQENTNDNNNSSGQNGSVNQNSSQSGNVYAGGTSYSSVRPDSVNKSPENNSKSSESASSDKNRSAGSDSRSTDINRESAINRFITTLKIDDNAFSMQKGENKTNGVIEVAPAIIENRALLPARMLAESLGLQVDYDAKNKTILLTQPNDKEQKVLLILGNEMKSISRNQRNFVQNSAKVAIAEEVLSENIFVAVENGRILFPLRQIENIFSKLGLTTQIQWNHQTKEITIIR